MLPKPSYTRSDRKCLIVIADESIKKNGSVLNYPHNNLKKRTWRWLDHRTTALTAESSWTSVRDEVLAAKDEMSAKHGEVEFTLVLMANDGLLYGKALPGKPILVMFKSAPQLDLQTTKLAEMLASWGFKIIHLQYCWSALPFAKAQPDTSTPTDATYAVTGYMQPMYWGFLESGTVTIHDKYVMNCLRVVDAPLGDVKRYVFNATSKTVRSECWVGRTIKEVKNPRARATIDDVGTTQTIRVQKRFRSFFS